MRVFPVKNASKLSSEINSRIMNCWVRIVAPKHAGVRTMTKLATRKREIEQLEGFSIEIFDGAGNPADLNMQGVPPYQYNRKAPDNMTVIKWKSTRFQQNYPGFTCDVLNGDGSVAHGNTKLGNVRNK